MAQQKNALCRKRSCLRLLLFFFFFPMLFVVIVLALVVMLSLLLLLLILLHLLVLSRIFCFIFLLSLLFYSVFSFASWCRFSMNHSCFYFCCWRCCSCCCHYWCCFRQGWQSSVSVTVLGITACTCRCLLLPSMPSSHAVHAPGANTHVLHSYSRPAPYSYRPSLRPSLTFSTSLLPTSPPPSLPHR